MYLFLRQLLVLALLSLSLHASPIIPQPDTAPTSSHAQTLPSQPSRNRQSEETQTSSSTATGNIINLNLDSARAETPPPHTPIATPGPDQDARLAEKGFAMTTYYTCNAIGGREHCGWHEPVLKAEGGAGARTDVGVVMGVVACVAGVFAWGLL